MLCLSIDDTPESYKDYRNRSMTKHLDKIKNQMRQIKDCSLKGEDKRKLQKQMLGIIAEMKF